MWCDMAEPMTPRPMIPTGVFSAIALTPWQSPRGRRRRRAFPNGGRLWTMCAIGQLITAGTVSERATSNRWAVGAPPHRHDSRRVPQQGREVLKRILGDDDVAGLYMTSLLGAVEPHHSPRSYTTSRGLAFVDVPLEGENSGQHRLPAAHSPSSSGNVAGHEVLDHTQQLLGQCQVHRVQLSQRVDRFVGAVASHPPEHKLSPAPRPGSPACPKLGRSAWRRSGGPPRARHPGCPWGSTPTP